MYDKAALEELRKLLNAANTPDDQIARGVRLTSNGAAKVAERFGIEIGQVPDMLTHLAKYVSKVTEDNARFSYEKDFMGNITLHDAKSGKSKFIQGDSAFKLGDEIAANPSKEEEIIAKYFDVTLLAEADEDGFDLADKGTFNFPYKGKFATASYGLENNKFALKVISLRDANDNEVELTPALQAELDRIALTWVDKV